MTLDELEMIQQRKFVDLMNAGKAEPKVNAPVDVTDETFESTVGKSHIVVIDCWAEWCGPCLRLGPIIEELAKDYSGRILFGKLNVDKNGSVSTKFGISSIPTLLVFKGGSLVDRIVGAMPKAVLEAMLNRHL